MMEIIAVETPSLGDRGYLVTDGDAALVVDAQRDIDRVLRLAAEHEVTITHVFETHIHNDYVTGGLALARATGAEYLVNGADPVSFERTAIADGEQVQVGRLGVRVIGSPGHTFTHLSYVVADDSGSAVAAFTGGSLLNGSTGRTDLLGDQHKVALARAQFGSARRLAAELADGVAVCPTHGFGSFCSATPAGGGPSTIGDEKLVNPALTRDETAYVEELLAGLDSYPAYYARMAPANLACRARPQPAAPGRAGRIAPPDRPRRVDRRPALAHGLRRRSSQWLAELRGRRESGYLPGLADPLGNAADASGGYCPDSGSGTAGSVPHRHRQD
jgi:hydroxyacylglutathione hydrolase